MKILLANKYYYLKGGDCTYFLEMEKLLRQRGHQVAVFCMQHPNNYETPYSTYFPSEVDFSKKGILNSIRVSIRPIFSLEVKNNFERILDDFAPDIIHLNNIHSQLSPIIAQIAKKRNIPVIWTQHDYKSMCPAYICTRDHQPCELCFKDKINVIKHKCIKGSLAASTLAFIESKVWDKDSLESYTHKFICPSQFIQKKMIQAGFSAEKTLNLPYFINLDKTEPANPIRGNYYCYVGRLVQEKGLVTLLEAATDHPDVPLLIIGTGPQEGYLKEKYPLKHVQFLGYQKWPEIEKIVKNAKFMVVPSEWYENYPLSIIESLSLGTPVLGSDAGGIPEMINEGVSGFTFKSRNVSDLKEKLNRILSDECVFDYAKIQSAALNKYSADTHYDEIMAIYSSATEAHEFLKTSALF